MIIGIDISSIPYGTGVSNYTLNLVRNLIKIDKVNQYKLLFYSLRLPLPSEISQLATKPNVTVYHYRFPPSLIEFIWNRLHLFPLELFIGRCDVFHTWEWTQPPAIRTKLVSTVHDLVPFLYPEWQHPKTIATFKRKMDLVVKEKTHLICVSQSTKNDLCRLFPTINYDKVDVIYEAAENKYDEFFKLNDLEKQKKINIIHQQYGLKYFILAQGTREPRKNLDRLVEAFNLFLKRNPGSKFILAIAGKYGWGNDIQTPNSTHIKILGYIPEKDLVALHAAATCLVLPSLYEGFGIPIVKAMKVGTPVITSNISSMAEITGAGAMLVDPNSAGSIADAIEKIIKSASLRLTLIQKGLKQASKFSWETTAAQTLQVYQSLN